MKYMKEIQPESSELYKEKDYESYGLRGTFDIFDRLQAESFAKRIDVDTNLEKHRNILVKKTALMMPDLSGKYSLDIGTGEGRWARFMSTKGSSKVVGIDTSQPMLDIARTRTSDESIHFLNNDISALNDSSFDFANAFFITNYIKNLDKFYRNLYRVLGPNGEQIFTVKTVEFDTGDKRDFSDYLLPILGINGSTIFTYPHSQEDYLDTVSRCGFEIINLYSDETNDKFKNNYLNSVNFKINDLVVYCRKRS